MLKKMKGCVYLYKVFNKSVDGRWDYEFGEHEYRTKLDRKFVKVRVEDYLHEKGTSFDCYKWCCEIDSETYIVYVRTKKSSKVHDLLIEYGFKESEL